MSKILECNDLSKSFGTLKALDSVSFSLDTGKIVGLLGPNGSGKTTLIKLANGLIRPSGGSISINGNPPGVETKKYVSYLPDKNYFDQWMKVNNCLDMFEDFYEDFDKAKAVDMMLSMGININHNFRTLSKGTKEKVQLALVMSRKAYLYLLDEPIGGVDPAARDLILNTIIKNYNYEGTVLISTHLIQDIEKVLDDIIFIKEGKIERIASVDEIREKEGKSVDAVFREVFKC